jgi:hypothetical protein
MILFPGNQNWFGLLAVIQEYVEDIPFVPYDI